MFTLSHVHPMLVHFPIALVASGFLLELIYLFRKKEVCFTKAGYYLLILGTLAAIITWLSGMLFTAEMEGAAGQVRETHELMATITVILLVIVCILLLWVVGGVAMTMKWIPYYDLGYAWFNTHIFMLF